MYGNKGLIEDSIKLFNEMKQNITIDTVTYNTLINLNGNKGLIEQIMHSRGLPQPLPPYNGASSFWEINYVRKKIRGTIRIFSFGFRTIYYFLYYCFILEHIYTRNIHVYPFHQQVVSEATKV